MSAPIPISGVVPHGEWRGEPIDRVVLDYDGRHRRRIVLTGESGAAYLLDLPEALHLRDGDGLRIAGRGVVAVVARPEPLLEVRAANSEALTRLAWHIGNRHLAAPPSCRAASFIRRDHVIAHMLEHQGASVREVEEPLRPRGAAPIRITVRTIMGMGTGTGMGTGIDHDH